MLRFTAFFWAYTVSWVCAAFIHSVDADINGFHALFAPIVLVSITFSALAIFIPSTLCYAAYIRGRWRAFFGSVCVFAVCLGTLLVMFGFGGKSIGSWVVGFAGSGAIFGIVLVLASLPMVLSRRPGNTAVVN